ncbi:MAG: hypothetical protein U0524_03485, partial [Candidatus Saccharimonadales bacterium]
MKKPKPSWLELFRFTRGRSSDRVFFIGFLSVLVTPVFSYTRARAHTRTRGVSLRSRIILLATVAAILIGIVGSIALKPQHTTAAVSDNLNFQARLENSDGSIVADGNYNVRFKLYNAPTGGSSLWGESYLNSASQGVRVVNGYLTVNLGSITSFPGTISWDESLYVTMEIGGAGGSPSWDGEMSPRLKLTAVPYAFQAKSATQLQTANSGNVATLSFTTPTANNSILLPNASGTVCLEAAVSCGFAPTTGGSGYIQNSTSLQTNSNFRVQTSGTGLTTAVIQALTGQTSDLLTFLDSSGSSILAKIDASGNISTAGTLGVTGLGTFNGGLTVGAGNQFTNASSTVLSALAISDQATSGPVGSAASTVDVATTLNLNQSTSGVSLTLPSPTDTTAGRILYVSNTGSVVVNVDGIPLAVGTSASFIWNGTTWIALTTGNSTAGVTTVGSLDGQTKSANGAVISGTTIFLQSADASNVGLVTASGSQTFGGDKTFNGVVTLAGAGTGLSVTNNASIGGNLGVTGTLSVTSTSTLTGLATLNGGLTVANNSNITQTGTGSFSTGTGAVSLNGNTSVTGSNTFTVGTGATTLGGTLDVTGDTTVGGTFDVTGTSTFTDTATFNGGISNTSNYLQTGAGTFSTGTGAVSLNGPTSVTGANSFTVGTGATTLGGTLTVTDGTTLNGILTVNAAATFNSGLTISSGSQFTNESSTVLAALTISDHAASGSIGTAAATVDIATTLNVNQTTPGISLTLPTPTDSTGGRLLYVSNVGTEQFQINGIPLASGSSASFMWNGTTWVALTTGNSTAGVTDIGTLDGYAKSADGAAIDGTTLYLQSADATYAGLVTATTQTFGGNKTFNGTVTISGSGTGLTVTNDASIGGDLGVTGSLAVTDTSTFTGLATLNGGLAIGNNSNFTQTGTGTFSTGSGAVSLNGNTSVTGSNTFTVGTGATTLGGLLDVAGDASVGGIFDVTGTSSFTGLATFSGGVTINNDSNFLQTGAGTFSTGTGAVSLNGNTIVTTGNDFTVFDGATALGGTLDVTDATTLASTLDVTGLATFDGGLTVSAGNSFINESSTVLTALNIADLPTGGVIGTAAATVDIATTLNMNQTTAGQSMSIPNPTSSTAGRILYISNTGTADFIVNGVGLIPDTSASFIWNGTTWVALTTGNSTAGVTTIGTLDGQAKSADGATISGTSLFLQSADATYAGVVTATTQTFGGNKTFNGTVTIAGAGTGLTVTNDASIGGNLGVTGTLSVTSTTTLTGQLTANGGITNTGSYNQTGTGTFSTGTGTVSLNGDTSVTGSNTFTVGTGATTLGGTLDVASATTISGNLTLNNNSNFLQSGTGTFTTGTGVVTLNGSTTITGTNTFTVGTGATTLGGTLDVTGQSTFTDLVVANGGLSVATGYTFENASSTLFTSMAIANHPTGGTIGTAPATVDVATTFDITQTTAGQDLTLPDPTDSTSGRIVYVNSMVGNAVFTMYGATIGAGASASFIWNGTAWVPTSSGSGVNTIGALDGQTKSANGAVISGSTLYLQSADATSVGIVTATSQTFGGDKTFNGTVTIAGAGTGLSVINDATIGGALTVNGAATFTDTLAVTGITTLTGQLNTDGGIANTGSYSQTGTGTFSTGTGTVSLNGNTSVTGSNTFTVGTGATTLGGTLGVTGQATFSGGVTINNNSNFLQSGTGTFATGTGAVSLNGDTIVTTGSDFTVYDGATTLGGTLDVTGATTLANTLGVTGLATFNGGLTVVAGQQLTNAGSTLFSAINIANHPTGGNIGTAAATVDVATTFNVTQTTAGQTLTLPDPTDPTPGRLAYVNSVAGNAIFLMYGNTVLAGTSVSFMWNGSDWVTTGASGINAIGGLDAMPKATNGAVIDSSILYLQSADATYAGLVTATTQTFGGNKTFNGTVTIAGAGTGLTVTNDASIGGNLGVTGTLSVTSTTTLTGQLTANGGITNTGSYNQTGTGTFSTGTGTVSLNGDTSVTGSNTFTVGTGATTLGGNLGVSGTTTLTGALNTNGGINNASGTTITNAGATVFTAIPIGDHPSGGNIGTAATTVDVATTFNVTQTTPGQTLTLPDPTTTTSGRVAYINSLSGNAQFLMYGTTINPSSSVVFIWNGTEWVSSGSSGINGIGTLDSQAKNANGAVIAGSNLVLQSADATYAGLVTATTQTFGGDKTFNGVVTLSGAGTGLVVTNAASIGGTLTVTGAATFNGALTVNNDLTIAAGRNFINGGSTLLTAITIPNSGSNGVLGGSAGATVDIATTFNVNQTTASRVFTLANPTVSTAGRIIYVNNVGSATFTVNSVTVAVNNSAAFVWNGTTWVATVTSGSAINNIGTFDTFTAAADGATIFGTAIFFQSASGGVPGMVNTTTQTFAGNKTFSGTVTIQGSGTGLSVLNDGSIGGNLSVTGTTTLTSLLTANGGITNTGSYSQTGSGTFSTGTGIVTLNGNTSVTGNNTFTVGTGATALGGNLGVAGTSTYTGLATYNGGVTIAAGTTLTVAGSTVFTSMAIADHPSGGDIGTAAATIDGHSSFDITQTTAGQTLSLPTPASTGSARVVYINSLPGNATFTMYGVNITAGNSASFIWNGTAWVAASTGGNGVNNIGTIDSQTKNANGAVIVGSTLYLQTADATNTGLITSGTQTIGGAKTFNGAATFAASGTGLTVTNNASIGGDLAVTGNTNLTGTLTVGTGATTLGGSLTVGGITTLSTLGTTDTASLLCRNASNQIAACNTTGTGAVFVQGGNSFGAAADLGTNDAYGLGIKTNGVTRISISSTGAITLPGLTGGVLQTDGSGLVSTGSINVTNGGTGATSFTVNGILYGNGTSPVQATNSAANAILATDGAGAPSLTQTLPTAVQGNITGTGALANGSIASGFGTITTANNITTSATVQGANVNATSAIQLGGADINVAGTLTNVGYLNQANTFTASNTFSAAGVGLAVTNNATIGGTLGVTGAITGGTYNGQTISSAASLTGTLNIAGLTTLGSLGSADNAALLCRNSTGQIASCNT